MGILYYFIYAAGNTGSGTVTLTGTFGTLASQQTCLCFLYSISGQSIGLSFNVYVTVDSSLNAKFVFIFNSMIMTGMGVYLLRVDSSLLLSTFNITADLGYQETLMGSLTANPIPSTQLVSNFMTGLTSIQTEISTSPQFTVTSAGLTDLSGTLNYVNLTYVNFRKWRCASTTYYYSTNDSCLSACPTLTYMNSSTLNC